MLPAGRVGHLAAPVRPALAAPVRPALHRKRPALPLAQARTGASFVPVRPALRRKRPALNPNPANYRLNPSVLMCPFDGSTCRKVNYRLNGNCKVSQLYSHWSLVHKGNPAAAKRMTEQWRHAFKNSRITRVQLDAVLPLEWGSEEDEGYEARRRPALGAEQAFPHTFALNSDEYRAWLCDSLS